MGTGYGYLRASIGQVLPSLGIQAAVTTQTLQRGNSDQPNAASSWPDGGVIGT